MFLEKTREEEKNYLTIVLEKQESFTALAEELQKKIEDIDESSLGREVVLEVGHQRLSAKQLKNLAEILLGRGLHLKKLVNRKRCIDLLVNEESTPYDKTLPGSKEEEVLYEDTILIRRTLRSGQRIFYQGNVVVLGDVNPGAEIIAGRNIIIIGNLRGLVHAGALGAEDMIVVALRMNPTQLRIANHFTRAPEGEGSAGHEPEMAYIKEGKVVIERLKV